MVFYLRSIALIFLLTLPAQAGQSLTLAMAKAQPIIVGGAIVKAAYEKIDIDATLKVLPTKRAFEEAISGTLDGDVGRMDGLSREFPSLIQIPVPINTVDGVAITCYSHIGIRSAKDLYRYRVGIRSGVKFSEELTKGLPTTKAENWNKLFELLKMGRLDVVIAFRGIEHTQNNRLRTTCFTVNEPPLVRHHVYHYLHTKHRDLVPIITDTLQTMHDSGEMAKIREQALKRIRSDQ